MKQSLILCFLAICSFFCCTDSVAQEPKFVIVNATDLIVRKAPNTQAPRLMVDHYGEGLDSDVILYNWSTAKLQRGYKRSAYHPDKGEVLEVVKTEGDWTQVKIIWYDWVADLDEHAKIYLAWVSSKYVQDINPVPFERPSGEVIVEDYYKGQILKRGGKYDGYMLDYEDGLYSCLKVSQVVDGVKIYYGSVVEMGMDAEEYSQNMQGMVIEKDENGYSVCLGKDRRYKGEERTYDFNLFTDSEIEALLKLVRPKGKDYLYKAYRFKNPSYNPKDEYSQEYRYCYSMNESKAVQSKAQAAPFTTKRISNTKKSYTLTVDYPTSDSEVAEAIKKHIRDYIGIEVNVSTENGEELVKAKVNEADGFDEEECPDCFESITFEFKSSNSRAITYKYSSDEYGGGTHGDAYEGYMIFRGDNGKLVEDFFNSKAESFEFKRLIANGLKKHFGEGSKKPLTDAQMLEELFCSSIKDIALPGSSPEIKNGYLILHYSHYEIGPYASGCPTAKIPLAQAKKFLSEEAKYVFGLQ